MSFRDLQQRATGVLALCNSFDALVASARLLEALRVQIAAANDALELLQLPVAVPCDDAEPASGRKIAARLRNAEAAIRDILACKPRGGGKKEGRPIG